MDLNTKVSVQNKLKKIFGIGPTGAIISLFSFAIFVWADSMIKLSIVVESASLMKIIGIVLVIFGLWLHFWSFSTLRSWWVDGKLCLRGPFKHFRHPMYTAWITFISPGVALYLNSWFYLFWVLLLHLLWHKLVKKEEIIMIDTFGDKYKNYARRTGRFFPKVMSFRIND
ncbi:methyltransferase family protein [Desulfosarcina sp.]|uniref:methyltransferase family protein n=1 Tax=Desulfosarcina sp. TaxID=2027861 RepID=UPI0039705760